MVETVVVNRGVHVTVSDHPEVILTTEEEPLESGVCFHLRGDRLYTRGYASGRAVEFLVPPSAASRIRRGAKVWVGNIGGSEQAFVASRVTSDGVLRGICVTVQSIFRRIFN